MEVAYGSIACNIHAGFTRGPGSGCQVTMIQAGAAWLSENRTIPRPHTQVLDSLTGLGVTTLGPHDRLVRRTTISHARKTA